MRLKTPNIDLYQLLGVQPTVTASEINRAYADQIMRWHPDKAAPEFEDYATTIMKQLNQAREWLTNAGMREIYNTSFRRDRKDFEVSAIDKFKSRFGVIFDDTSRTSLEIFCKKSMENEGTSLFNTISTDKFEEYFSKKDYIIK